MKKFITLIILFQLVVMAQDFNTLNSIFENYEKFKEQTLTHRRFKHAEIVPLIQKLKKEKKFSVSVAGKSVEEREIFLLKIGSGKKKVFLWSQMHGDEPTATMALFDIFNFFTNKSDFAEFKKNILDNTTLYFMPMVNPDGAERYQRRNVFEIDINRDAVRLETPEANILMKTFDSLKADFGFNLHDQSTRYTAGNSSLSAAISFLAPAYNYEKSINETRGNATRLIGAMNNVLQNFIPGHIAKYDDSFEPRAFGDNFQMKGTSTILIESGGWEDDPEKQFLRKINFIALLSAFNSIANESYKEIPLTVYDNIPFNDKYLFDLLIRNVSFQNGNEELKVDVGINLNESNNDSAKSFILKSVVEDFGDLSIFYGYKDYNFTGYKIEPGKIYPNVISSLDQLKKLNAHKLYDSGYTSIKINFEKLPPNLHKYPFHFIVWNENRKSEFNHVGIGNPANFILRKDDEISYVLVNGFLFDVKNNIGEIKFGLLTR